MFADETDRAEQNIFQPSVANRLMISPASGPSQGSVEIAAD